MYTEEPLDAVPSEQIRSSSKGRPWHGMSLWHQLAGNDDLYIPAAGKHCIIVRRGPSTGLMQRHGSATHVSQWNTGEIVLLPERTPSFWRTELDRDNIHLDLSPLWLERVQEGEGRAVALRSCFGAKDPLLSRMVHMLMLSLDDNSSMQPRFAEGIATSVAVHLLEHYRDSDPQTERIALLSARQLKRVEDLVESQMDEAVPLEAMAAQTGLSVFHFSRCFKATSGETPHQFVLNRRLDRAKTLLLDSQRSVAEVAAAIGFSTPSHFAQAFKRRWGATPGQFRRDH
ncbi:AraC family transcriptional regulator [Acidovorax sp. 69]|nr:AraC family transcriptional regulator [Acidovorax sp. 69]